jgi:hypothetical protein
MPMPSQRVPEGLNKAEEDAPREQKEVELGDQGQKMG